MTEKDFNKLKDTLFVRYPSLHEWLHEKSPNPLETLRSWFRRLQAETLSDCLQVLDAWETGNQEPFAAYQKDQVPSVIKSAIARIKDQRFKQEQERERMEQTRDYLDSRRSRANRSEAGKVGFRMDSAMLRAFEILQPYERRMRAGEITSLEYQVICVETHEAVTNKEYAQ